MEWAPFDWVEEAHPVVGHPHDPFKRIDLLPSERHVVVRLGGVVLADTRRAIALYETHIPVRWYLPHDDVVTDLLEGSPSTTTCAYKGHAAYVSLRPDAVPGLGEEARHDIAWTYPHPLDEVAAIRGMFCFYSERTDLELDGVAVPRPVTPVVVAARPGALLTYPHRRRAARSSTCGGHGIRVDEVVQVQRAVEHRGRPPVLPCEGGLLGVGLAEREVGLRLVGPAGGGAEPGAEVGQRHPPLVLAQVGQRGRVGQHLARSPPPATSGSTAGAARRRRPSS